MENQENEVKKEECTHDCSTCGAACGSKKSAEPAFELQNKASNIKHVIAVMSGKGGVGKSTVTASLAVMMQRLGYRTAILDADITGASVPKLFGLKGEIKGNEDGILPLESISGIKAMSINILMQDESSPVIWRGPVISGTVKQFWSDVVWGEVDYMFIDMPPGTGDVPLTIMQSVPLNGIIFVATPADMVANIVKKSINMALMMNAPIYGLVENYSYFECPNCNEKHEIFGHSAGEKIAESFGIPLLARVPISPKTAALCDAGTIETIETDAYDEAVTEIIKRS